jgi:hypothetical protein
MEEIIYIFWTDEIMPFGLRIWTYYPLNYAY